MTESQPLTASSSEPEERALESALRPKNLDDFVGQQRVRHQLSLVLEASKIRGRTRRPRAALRPARARQDHPGHDHRGRDERPAADQLSGPAIQHAGDLAAILSSLSEGEVLFLDEIHRMSRPAEEMLYMAMEDFRVDIIVGKGAGATAIPLELPPFTLVGATTRAGLLPGPLRDRFGFTGHLEFYCDRGAGAGAAPLGHAAGPEGQLRRIRRDRRALPRHARASPTGCCAACGTGRWCTGSSRSTPAAPPLRWTCTRSTRAAWTGWTATVLHALCTKFGGGPVGLSTLAIAVGEETETVETVAEPYLVREGLLGRTPRGRIATAAAWAHLGLAMPADAVLAAGQGTFGFDTDEDADED